MLSPQVWTATAAVTSLLAVVVTIAFFRWRARRNADTSLIFQSVKLILPKGHYEGGFVGGQRSGLGTYTWPDGRVYEGNWADGKRNGPGKLIWAANGEVHVGAFSNNEIQGFGVRFKDGAVVGCGRWKNGRLAESRSVPRNKLIDDSLLSPAARAADPSRTLLLPSGGHYVGGFNADFKYHGQGVEFRADGSEWASGQWRDGKLHGRGQVNMTNGGRYEGEFVVGKFSGLGAWADGRAYGHVYEGEWANDRRSGLGVQWDKDGKVTNCGRWEKDKLVEKRPVPRSKIPIGVHLSAAAKLADLICPSGGFYCGAVDLNHQPHGWGTLFRAGDSEAVRGDWTGGRLWVSGSVDAQGRLQGAGSEWTVSGLFEGEFVDGRRSGLGVRWDEAGKMVGCGRWANDELINERPVPRSKIPVGVFLSASVYIAPRERTLLLSNGGHYVGELNADFRQHDDGVEFTAHGFELSGQWRDGKQHGRGKVNFSSGSRFGGEFVDGKKSGLSAYTFANGGIFEGEWSASKVTGFAVAWNKDGQVIACGRWTDNELVEKRSVPRSKIPVGKFLSAAAKASALLFPDGGFYRGEINDQFQRHGVGSMHSADGATVSEGVWRDDRLLSAAEVNALAAAALSPSAASVAPPIAAPADSSECVVCQDARPDCHTGCAHICMCMDCAKQVQKCPQCRQTIAARTKVFIS